MVALKHGQDNSDLPEKMREVLQILGKEPGKNLYKEKTYEEIAISPKQAEKLLKFNSELNRKKSDRRVSSLRKNILEYGYCTIDPICFDEQWSLRNGQHRLTALSQLKKGLYRVLFAFNVPEEDLVFADMGMNRTVSQQLAMMGLENGPFIHPVLKGVLKGQFLDFKNETAWNEAMGLYEPAQQFSAKEVEDIYSEHMEAFDFVITLFSLPGGWRRKKRPEPVKGVFFRAWHYENHEMLKEFVRLYKGDYDEGEDPRYIKLVQAFEARIKKLDCQNRSGTILLYRITEYAVNRFCTLGNKKVGDSFRFDPYEYELYPLPQFDRRPAGKSFNQSSDD